MPAQMYCVIFGLSASLVGPFAGFLASGFKRAYGIKDFATTFPGHGGICDRCDCQIYSAIFCGMILRQFMFRDEIAMDNIVKDFDMHLGENEQTYILELLKNQIS